jgi:tRNA dimethylallyltransferase
MNIGTAKVCSRASLPLKRSEPITHDGIPHYLIDILLPNQQYSAAEFKTDAHAIINDIIQRGRTPIIVGGTGFYIRVLAGDQSIPNAPPDPAFRTWAEQQTRETLLSNLQALDPISAQRVEAFDRRRIIRALEIAKNDNPSHTHTPPIGMHKYAILPNRTDLQLRIRQRTDEMFANGLLEEARTLLQTYGKDAPGMQTIGYRELIPLIDGTVSEQETRDAVFRATWQYARRQMVWIKKEPNVTTAATPDELLQRVYEYINKNGQKTG